MQHDARPARGQTTRQGGLQLARIIEAAVAIADEEGLSALSMRRVADRLGHGVMSLYRHVDDKERLIDLASDIVFAEETFPSAAPDGWRNRLRESAMRQWRCYGRHPWIAATVSLSRPRLGPNGMREMEWALAGMPGLPVPDHEKARAYLVVTAYVHGAAGQMASERRDANQSGRETADWWGDRSEELRALFATGEFPVLARLRPGIEPSPGAWFEFGLESLLEGLAARMDGQSTA